MARSIFSGLAAALLALLAGACQRPAAAPPMTQLPPRPGQRVVDDSLAALDRMRAQPGHEALDTCLRCARGVMVFPRVVWQSDDWRGRGVLLSRNIFGQWSAPAFYALGTDESPPVEGRVSSIVLVFVSEHALKLALDGQLTLGARHAGTTADGHELCQLIGAGAVYSGGNLEGLTIRSLDALTSRYYRADATAYAVMLDPHFDHPSATALKQLVGEMSQPSEPAPACKEPFTRKLWRQG